MGAVPSTESVVHAEQYRQVRVRPRRVARRQLHPDDAPLAHADHPKSDISRRDLVALGRQLAEPLSDPSAQRVDPRILERQLEGPSKVLEQGLDACLLGDEMHRPNQFRPRPLGIEKEILGKDDAPDIVDVALMDRNAQQPRGPEHRGQFAAVEREVERLKIDPRDPQRAAPCPRKLDDAMDQGHLTRIEQPFGLADADQLLQFIRPGGRRRRMRARQDSGQRLDEDVRQDPSHRRRGDL